MTHEEKEVQHYISKLQEKVHQILLSQRETKNEMEVLKKGAEAKMDGLKNGMEAKMNGMEANMDGLKNGVEVIEEKLKANMEGLKKLIQ